MQLILLEKIQNLGNLGDLVDVKPGFGRNYLVPQGKAVPATRENIERFEAQRAELEKAAAVRLGDAETRLVSLTGVVVRLEANASEEGKLYGSIGPREVAEAVSAQGYPLNKSEVVMGDGPIRMVGEHDVLVQLHADIDTTIKVIVDSD